MEDIKKQMIRKKSQLTGKVHLRAIPITDEQLVRWAGGELIQNVAPHLSADDREFLISGITPEEWDEVFPEESNTDYGETGEIWAPNEGSK